MGAAAVLVIIVIIVGYFLPSIVALARSHKDAPAIVLVNLILGWSVVGWFVSLVWALSDPRGRAATQTVVINTQHNIGTDPPLAQRIVPPTSRQPALTAAPQPKPLPSGGVAKVSEDDKDTAFWDAMADKNDPDLLEEYLIRFPGGRFAPLARKRLERRGVEPPPHALPAPKEPTDPTCARCGTPLEPGSRFCTECGAEAAV